MSMAREEEEGGRRNRRLKTKADARSRRKSGRDRAPRVNSFRHVVEDGDALRLEVAALLGVVGNGGGMAGKVRWLSVLTEKRKGGLVAARGEEEGRLGFGAHKGK
jgi:hypothetical protein